MKTQLLFSIFPILLVVGCGNSKQLSLSGDHDAEVQEDEGLVGDASGSDGTSTQATGVLAPSKSFLARQVQVTISVNNTEWTTLPKVNFGKNITIREAKLLNSKTIVADLSILADAELGPHDVSVTSDKGSLILKEAFTVEASLALDAKKTLGSVAQGSVIKLDLENKDTANPWSKKLRLTSPIKSAYLIYDLRMVDPLHAQVTILTDVKADPKIIPVSITDTSSQRDYITPNALTLKDQTTTEVSKTGYSLTGTFQNPYDSELFSIPSLQKGMKVLRFGLSSYSDGHQTYPTIYLFPSTGKSSELLHIGDTSTGLNPSSLYAWDSEEPLYGVFSALSDHMAKFGISIQQKAAASIDFDPKAKEHYLAQGFSFDSGDRTKPVVVTKAKLETRDSEHWLKLLCPNWGVGRYPLNIRVTAVGGDRQTKIRINIFSLSMTPISGWNQDGEKTLYCDYSSSTGEQAYYIKTNLVGGGTTIEHQDYQLILSPI